MIGSVCLSYGLFVRGYELIISVIGRGDVACKQRKSHDARESESADRATPRPSPFRSLTLREASRIKSLCVEKLLTNVGKGGLAHF